MFRPTSAFQPPEAKRRQCRLGAQNVIGLSNGPAGRGEDSFADSRIRHLGIGPDRGIWNYQELSSEAPHEFSHLVGMQDRDSGNSIANHFYTWRFATGPDSREAFGSVVRSPHTNIAAGIQSTGRVVMVPGTTGPQTVNGVFGNSHRLFHWWHW
jgi:hypothetical protein